MGRHQKKGLDYFPLDVHMDDSVALLEVDHGLEGFAILIKLYQKIYANGYYLHVSDKGLKLLSRNINVDINQLNIVINSAIYYHIFDKYLHENYQILTSSGIQQRYLFAVERRISVDFIKQFLLLEENVYINMKNVNIKEVNVAEIGINDNRSTYIKLKKSKLKNISKKPENSSKKKSEKEVHPLYESIKEAFLSKNDGIFSNWAKEGTAINQLIKKSEARFPEDPGAFIKTVMDKYYKLTRNTNDKYWSGHPFVPSSLNSSGIFDRVLKQLEITESTNFDNYDFSKTVPEGMF